MRRVLALSVALAATPQVHAESASPDPRNPLAALQLETLGATRDRPLFSPTRRPAPPPAEVVAPAPAPSTEPALAKPTEPEPPPFELVGVVVGEVNSYVLLRNRASHEVVRLRQGEAQDGWRVGQVSLRAAVLERDGRIEQLAISPPAATGAQALPQLAGPAPTVGADDHPRTEDAIDATPTIDPPSLAEFKRLTKKLKRER